MEKAPKFSVGDSVMFTNDAGLVFGPYTVTDIEMKDENFIKYDRRYYLNWDAPWFPAKGEQLTLTSASHVYRVVNKKSPMYGHQFPGTPSVANGESWVWDNNTLGAYRAANCEVVQ